MVRNQSVGVNKNEFAKREQMVFELIFTCTYVVFYNMLCRYFLSKDLTSVTSVTVNRRNIAWGPSVLRGETSPVGKTNTARNGFKACLRDKSIVVERTYDDMI